ncbi:alcohol dehydrogenase catalytic domain-containing protein [Streptomyces sp. NPDC101175]|uniref:alcohol dehydrogenase catalytic domain-containing protein n=1 Tax=Streptomyces sp. NPDC101175 TaxID=3366123 RepID=UPI0038350308
MRYDRFDGVDQLWIDEVPEPEGASGQAVVRVHASCINPGSVPASLHGAPYTPIRDLAGVVVGVGDGVREVKPGDEVLGWSQDWTAHAEYVAVPAAQLIAKPAGLPWDVAGSLFVTPMAGLAGVKAVDPSEGEVVVVSAAAGGVGFTAAQLARRTGATVIGMCSPSKADHVRERDIIPVSFVGNVASNVREAAGAREIDAFIDAFGSGYIQLALDLGVPRDRINTAVDYKSAKEQGVTARGTMDAGGLPAYRMLAELAASGDLAVPVAATYPLAQVKAAYTALLAERRPFGRVVLHPQE